MYGAFAQSFGFIRADEIGIDKLFESEPRTIGAGAVRRVEREQTGFYFFDGNAAIGAGVRGGKQFFVAVAIDNDQPVRKFKRGFERIGKAL